MYLPLGSYSPDIKLGLVSASRNCFPRSLSEERTQRVLAGCRQAGIETFVPEGPSQIIETKDQAIEAARQFKQAGRDAHAYFLGKYSPDDSAASLLSHFHSP